MCESEEEGAVVWAGWSSLSRFFLCHASELTRPLHQRNNALKQFIIAVPLELYAVPGIIIKIV